MCFEILVELPSKRRIMSLGMLKRLFLIDKVIVLPLLLARSLPFIHFD